MHNMNKDDNQKIKQDLKQAMDDLDKIKGPQKDKLRKDIQGVSVDLHQAQIDRKEEEQKQRKQQEEEEKEQREVEKRYYAKDKNIRNFGYLAVTIAVIVLVIVAIVSSR